MNLLDLLRVLSIALSYTTFPPIIYVLKKLVAENKKLAGQMTRLNLFLRVLFWSLLFANVSNALITTMALLNVDQNQITFAYNIKNIIAAISFNVAFYGFYWLIRYQEKKQL